MALQERLSSVFSNYLDCDNKCFSTQDRCMTVILTDGQGPSSAFVKTWERDKGFGKKRHEPGGLARYPSISSLHHSSVARHSDHYQSRRRATSMVSHKNASRLQEDCDAEFQPAPMQKRIGSSAPSLGKNKISSILQDFVEGGFRPISTPNPRDTYGQASRSLTCRSQASMFMELEQVQNSGSTLLAKIPSSAAHGTNMALHQENGLHLGREAAVDATFSTIASTMLPEEEDASRNTAVVNDRQRSGLMEGQISTQVLRAIEHHDELGVSDSPPAGIHSGSARAADQRREGNAQGLGDADTDDELLSSSQEAAADVLRPASMSEGSHGDYGSITPREGIDVGARLASASSSAAGSTPESRGTTSHAGGADTESL